jgi:NAD(P)-dependent dehydrogenase (short-subunit alcohol dehydrogenase family)
LQAIMMVESPRYLVTGGTSGIGRAVAHHLTHSGTSVWITGTRNETVEAALAAGVAQHGSVCDVADADAVEQVFDRLTTEFATLDGVFVNGGIDGEGIAAAHVDPEHFRRVIDVNVIGSLRIAQAAYPVLTRPGALVFNASVNALRPEANFIDYNASKAATVSLAQSLALEWSAEELAVTAICPGYVRTPMTSAWMDDPNHRADMLARIPADRFGELPEIAELVSFLLSRRSQFLTGSVIPIAGASNV